MNRYSEPPNRGRGSQRTRAMRPERTVRQIDGVPGIGALRPAARLEPVGRRVVGAISRWRQRRAAVRALKALSDHYLADIGLDRGQIVSMADAVSETGGRTAPRDVSHDVHQYPRNRVRAKASEKRKIRSGHYIGVLLVVTSAITFSTAGLFTKGVEAGSWEVIFWRGFFAAAFTTFWTISRGTLRQNFFGMGYSGLTIAVVGATGTAAFITSFKLTSIANVSLIYAASPLIAALLAWLAIGERASLRTMVGCAGALLGVAIIVSGSLGRISLNGDLLALWMSTVMALIMVIYRKYPNTPGAGPAVLSSVLLLPFATIFGDPFGVERTEIYVLSAFGLLFAIASVTLAEGAKRVPSGQTALLSALETPLAPVFAFVLLAEIPNGATFVGGFVVLFAVFFSIRSDA